MIEQGKVMISLEGRCVCPIHGALGPDVEYVAGRAECGCIWTAGRDMLLRCKIAPPYPQFACPMLRIVRNKTVKMPHCVAF